MFDLTKIVIPRIMNEWQDIAEALRYDLSIIRAIEEKGVVIQKNAVGSCLWTGLQLIMVLELEK